MNRRLMSEANCFFLGHGLDDAAAAARESSAGAEAGLGCVACHTNLNDWNNEEQVPWIVVDLQKRENLSRLEAERRYAAMSYNERDAYAMMMQQPALVHFWAGAERDRGADHDGPRFGFGAAVADRMAEDPKQYHATTLMPNLRLTDGEASDLAAYLTAQTRDKADQDLRASAEKAGESELLQILDRKGSDMWGSTGAYQEGMKTTELADQGAKLIVHYGCMNCHEIGGPPLTQGMLDLSDWGRKPLELLDFSRLDRAHYTRQGLADSAPDRSGGVQSGGCDRSAAHAVLSSDHCTGGSAGGFLCWGIGVCPLSRWPPMKRWRGGGR